ncbi:MAG: metallophosphoesterase [Nanoarchaeota archaeon]|nr:metallophosphoesterase [Nanoarchaeota archaeon]
MITPKYELIDKTIFFPEEGVLAIGDLHIGYEASLLNSGIVLPETQVIEIIRNLKEILAKIEAKKQKVKKIIFLGDIKHAFGYEWKEKSNFKEILEFLKEYLAEENIILIKGNHDTMELGRNNKEYHIESNIFFTHGHQQVIEMYDKNIKATVSGHLHPSVTLSEKPGVKSETYKCFLIGKSKGKTFFILPSFLSFVEGTPINDYKEDYVESFSIIPKKDVLNSSVHVIGEDSIYKFGKVKDLYSAVK